MAELIKPKIRTRQVYVNEGRVGTTTDGWTTFKVFSENNRFFVRECATHQKEGCGSCLDKNTCPVPIEKRTG